MKETPPKWMRLIKLHRLFNSCSQGYRAAELSRLLGLSERSIERDIAELKDPPYDLPLQRDGWTWRLDRTQSIPLPPITLTREQAAALFIGARLLSQHSGRIGSLAEKAIGKLAQALPVEMGIMLEQVTTSLPQTKEELIAQEIFSILVMGWIDRHKVICVHQTLGGKVTHYHLAPYTFEPAAIGHAIYVRGQCDEDPPAQLRTLKLDRIRQATLTETQFEYISPQQVNQSLADAWRIWGSSEPPVEIRLRFSKHVSERVKETIWHLNQQIQDLADGGCEWCALVSEPKEMLPWIRGWGAECEVIAPLELRSSLIRETRHLARLYQLKAVEEKTTLPDQKVDAVEDEVTRLKKTFNDFFGG
ncbi:MAG: WYL domain-containing protein [Chloroflexota bacterium]